MQLNNLRWIILVYFTSYLILGIGVMAPISSYADENIAEPVVRLSVHELIESGDSLIGRVVSVDGILENIGSNYFTDNRLGPVDIQA